jgi:hypothetical protein
MVRHHGQEQNQFIKKYRVKVDTPFELGSKSGRRVSEAK